ncbi:MAG: NAD(P)-binding protein [Rubrivivax sp.]
MRDCDLAVIGGGLAGLHAAARAAQLGASCVAFTGPAPGGLLLSIESIEGLPDHPEGIPGYDLGAQEAAMDAVPMPGRRSDAAGAQRRRGSSTAKPPRCARAPSRWR